MSCSANHYLEWNSRLDSTLQTEPKRQIFCNSDHKKRAKISFCKHWKHFLVGATNIGSTDYLVLTMRYSRNSLC
jgi:hypothetical protein